jgi:hypothetical protein
MVDGISRAKGGNNPVAPEGTNLPRLKRPVIAAIRSE